MFTVSPVAVTNVEHAGKAFAIDEEEDGDTRCNDWTTITVERPERHELLVGSKDQRGMLGNAIAVSSCDREVNRHSVLSTRNTFLSSVPNSLGVHTRRASSAPPSLARSSGFRRAPSIADDVSTIPSSFRSESFDSESMNSLNSADWNVAATVKVGQILSGNDATGPQVARLSDVIKMNCMGVPSIGSSHTLHGECLPCSFHFTHLRLPFKRGPCKASFLCEYCHDTSHNNIWRSKFRKSKKPPAEATRKTTSRRRLTANVPSLE